MAIVAIDPKNWESSNTVQLDSDAASNREAILEIDDWAAEHGFARVNEYWLRPIVKNDGARVHRGVCYRLTPEEKASAEAACQSSAEVLNELATSPPQRDDDR